MLRFQLKPKDSFGSKVKSVTLQTSIAKLGSSDGGTILDTLQSRMNFIIPFCI